jgi:hypothetical protein
MYEHRTAPLLSIRAFLRRLGSHIALGLVIVAVSLLIGTLGYHHFGGQPWIDAFLNAAMLMGGMGQVGNVDGTPGKLFAAFFSLYAGIVLITVASIMLAPVIHRILHRLHLERVEVEESEEG